MHNSKNINNMQKQVGAVLVTALVLMSILTIIGITSMRSNIMDANIHNAMKSRSNAFQCAEAALRAGEIWLDRLTSAPDLNADITATVPTQNSFQFWDSKSTALADMEIQDTIWWEANGWSFGNGLINTDNQIGCATAPRFIIEYIGPVSGGSNSVEFASDDLIDFFRITARSEGINSAAAVVVQTTYARRLR